MSDYKNHPNPKVRESYQRLVEAIAEHVRREHEAEVFAKLEILRLLSLAKGDSPFGDV